MNKEILRYAPNSPAARDIIAERKRKEESKARYLSKWNRDENHPEISV